MITKLGASKEGNDKNLENQDYEKIIVEKGLYGCSIILDGNVYETVIRLKPEIVYKLRDKLNELYPKVNHD